MNKPTIRPQYVELLRKFAYNKEVEALLVEVVLDNQRVKRQCYLETGSYPAPYDLLDKLHQDLANTKNLMDYNDDDLYVEGVKNGTI